MQSGVERWVDDQLYNLIGCSDRTTVQYILALARKSTDSEDLVSRLQNADALQDSPAVRGFASELLSRVPHARKYPLLLCKCSLELIHFKVS